MNVCECVDVRLTDACVCVFAIAYVNGCVSVCLPSHRHFRVGQLVRVKPGVTPKYGWGSVTEASVGILVHINGPKCVRET